MIISDSDLAVVLACAQTGRKVDLIYFHLASRSSYRAATAIVPILAGISPRPLLIVGGHFASTCAQSLIEAIEFLDAVITGEIEVTLVALAQTFANGRAWWQEAGLWSRHDGTLRQTLPRNLVEDLDTLPRAATDLIEAGSNVRRQILVGRGCNSACSYCSLPVQTRHIFPLRQRFWRSRSPRVIVDEIEYLCHKQGITRFTLNSFVLFGYDAEGTELVEGIAHEILTRGLSVRFSFVTHPGHLCRNLPSLSLLQKAGLESIYLGIDSILDRARALYALPFSEQDIYTALAALHKEAVVFRTGYILYDPYLTLDEIGYTLAFLREVKPLYSNLGMPYALVLQQQVINTALQLSVGMPILEQLRRDGLIVREGSLEHNPLARFRERETGRFLRLHRRINREILSHVAPLVFHPQAEKCDIDLSSFILDILEMLCNRLRSDLESDDDELLSALRRQIVELLTPAWDVSREAGLLPCSEFGPVYKFFTREKGACHGYNCQ